MNKKNYEIQEIDGKKYAVYLDSGEVVDTKTMTVPQDHIIISFAPEAIAEKNKRKAQEQEEAAIRSYYKKYNATDHFYFCAQDETFNGITPASVARLIYLSTYLSYKEDGSLMITERRHLTKDNLMDILKIDRRSVGRFLSEVTPKYLTIDDKGNISAERSVFKRGVLTSNDSYMKMRIKGIQDLYKRTPKEKHKNLGYLFALLPYVSIEFNAICSNPYERDYNKIQFITGKQFCEMIGYSWKNFGRLMGIYSKLIFEVNGRQEHIVSFVSSRPDREDLKIYINPHILYSGTQYEKVKILGAFCKV